MNFLSKDYGISSNEDITVALQEALTKLGEVEGEKTLVFEKGEYHLYADKAHTGKLYITNSMGDNEWEDGVEPHLNKAGIWLENQKDLILDGNGSVFVMHGKMTNAVITNCENVKLVNMTFKSDNPDMHEIKVLAKGLTYVDFLLDEESKYEKINGKYHFVGDGYRSAFNKHAIKAYWIGKVPNNEDNVVYRVMHPFNGAFGVKEIKPNVFRAHYISAARFKVGDRFYIYDHLRHYNGIFVEKSKDVAFDKINQTFNYGLGLVCQDSENITLTNSKFLPADDSKKLVISAADFIHICMCRGDMVIKNNEFAGAGDDCLNVHGIHFKVVSVDGNKITVKFCHRQAHGFNPLRVGDTVAFVEISSLLEQSRATILKSTLVDEQHIMLELDDASKAQTGQAIEDKSAIANLDFSFNKMTRIITRGVLVTTGGKVRITDNDFDNTSMHSILISDDAKYWFESGPVNDVEIARNRFGRCIGYNVQVLPENTAHKGAVHKNIYVHDNILESGNEGGFFFKSADGVVLENNKSAGEIKIKSINSQVENRINCFIEKNMDLFEPCTVGKVQLKNRIIRSATHDGLADEDGGPSDKLISKYAFMAKNEVGCIIAGYAIVSKEGSSSYPRCLSFYNDEAKEKYLCLTDAVHAYGTPIIAQLAHCGRQTSSKVIGMKKIAPSAKRHLFYPDKAKEMSIEDIIRVEDAFADAIAKAKEYGFDGAQIHLAHGYLLHDFVSRNGNKRKDEYGKDIYGRLRIVKEILQKARAKVGDFPIWVKLSATDKRKKGMRISYSIEVCKLLKEYGVDAIEVSCGSVQDGMNTMRSKRMPMDAVFEYREPVASMPKFLNKICLACAKAVNPLIPQPKPLTMFNFPSTMAIKENVDIDLILVGGVAERKDMQKAIDSGIGAVSMCRPFICEPNFAKKLKEGKTEKSQCIMCNYCGLVIEKGETKCLLGKIKKKQK